MKSVMVDEFRWRHLHVLDLLDIGSVDVRELGKDGVRRFASIAEATPEGEVLDLDVAHPLETPEGNEEAYDVQHYDHDDRQEEVVLQRGGIWEEEAVLS